MKLAIAYSTKDQVELTKQTWPAFNGPFFKWWVDGSTDQEAIAYAKTWEGYIDINIDFDVRGGADAAIAYKLSKLLNELPPEYTHIGLLENDVLLDPDWLEPTLALFEKGARDGLAVGAVSPRSYVDRVLVQRDGYAVMHNLGAGVVIFTREAAEIVLQTFRTYWWPDNVKLFAQLSGIDLRTYAAFRGNDQWVTTDWGWEAQLARRGLASLALTPAKCRMIGQVPSLKDQGLELVSTWLPERVSNNAFDLYQELLAWIREGGKCIDYPQTIHRDGAGMCVFPHQIPSLNASYFGGWKLKWSQGFGPFSYRATERSSLQINVSGSYSFLVSGGEAGARVTIADTRSGFKTEPDLPASPQPVEIQVPGGPIPRLITCEFGEGAVFYGLSTADPQMIDTTWKFDWSQLPEAE